eukprot:1156395-Pelagomonas_calceolata.AAC.9
MHRSLGNCRIPCAGRLQHMIGGKRTAVCTETWFWIKAEWRRMHLEPCQRSIRQRDAGCHQHASNAMHNHSGDP